MLELAAVTGKDVLYDIGCGDGRIVITAARRYGARGVGIDIDKAMIEESERNAKAGGRRAARSSSSAWTPPRPTSPRRRSSASISSPNRTP